MKPSIYLHIPEPCNEDWSKMSATQQGRYCESCCKQVIDFSLMTDQEIVNHLRKASSKTCGRFTQDQLLRPLAETKIENKKGWKWLMASVISLVMINRSEAQQKKTATKQKKAPTEVNYAVKGDVESILVEGIVIAPPTHKIKLPDAIVIRGVVQDSAGGILAGATISSNGHAISYTNSKGEFSFTRSIVEVHHTLPLTFSFVGYEDFPLITVLSEDTIDLQVKLKPAPKLLDEIVVTAGKEIIAGGIGYYRPVPRKDTLPIVDTIAKVINKVFNTELFTLYPNPASKGSQVRVQIKEAGAYTLQLLDNQSRLLSVKETTVSGKAEPVQFSLSYTLPSAIYYVQVINTTTGKQFTSKLLVQ